MRQARALGLLHIGIPALLAASLWPSASVAQGTAFGEIEGRPAPVSLRRCVGGISDGELCKHDFDCSGYPCQDRNVFNLSVSVRFNATPAQLAAIQTALTGAGELLFDATDGQLQIGQATIWNNSSGSKGHIWITETGTCQAATGSWGSYSAGNLEAAIGIVDSELGAECLAHEIAHLVFDVRDEYILESPGCMGTLPFTRHCPLVESGEEPCLMECCLREGTEFCWGHGNPADPSDLSGGNHDPFLETPQSVCRAGRSCWEQIGWSWPNTFLVPAGAPDPAANGLVMDPLVFVQPAATARMVLVLDNSGSMGLETPTRLERLQVAALDVVDMAQDGVELGLVTFNTSATDQVMVLPLGSNRDAYTNAIAGLMPMGATNIGSALMHARDLIMAAGGVTGNTSIILMTDGRNNTPYPQAEQHLQAALDTLLTDGIPVFVTCTGDDDGLDSQCAEIAAGTGGTYVDSFYAADLSENFADFHEVAMDRHAVGSMSGPIGTTDVRSYMVEIEPGATEATFLVLWQDVETMLRLRVDDPAGTGHAGQPIVQGRYVRVPNPPAGSWAVTVEATQVTGVDRFVSRSYADNPKIAVPLALRHPEIQPGEAFELYAYPMYETLLDGAQVSGRVERPDGGVSAIQLFDDGGVSGSGDESPGDGVYTAVYADTDALGAYTFELQANAAAASPVCDLGLDCTFAVGDFARQTRISGTVDDALRVDCPRFDDPPTPRDGTVLFVDAGKTLTVPVQASFADAGIDVLLGHLGLPAGATLTHSPANPATGELEWATQPGDAGVHFVTFTATAGTCTRASAVEIRVVCDPLCVSVSVDAAGGGDPTLSMGVIDPCPAGGALPNDIDLVRGDLSALRIPNGHVSLGSVEPVACASAAGTYGFCSGRLVPGRAEFYLARIAGQAGYGASSSGLPRLAESGDCP